MKTDAQLQRDVIEELTWDPRVAVSEIGVSVNKGVVTLTGMVRNYAEKCAAEDVVRRVGGVRAVAEQLTVNSRSGERSDRDIAEAAANALAWHAYVPSNVKAVVEQGWVTLTGVVHWGYERSAALQAVRYLQGVKGVTNHIIIKPKVGCGEVKERIRKALERDAELEAKNINVETIDGTVRLTGRVRSWAERDEAGLAAWSAPGVGEVKNDIEVDYHCR